MTGSEIQVEIEFRPKNEKSSSGNRIRARSPDTSLGGKFHRVSTRGRKRSLDVTLSSPVEGDVIYFNIPGYWITIITGEDRSFLIDPSPRWPLASPTLSIIIRPVV